MKKLTQQTPDLTKENIDKIAELFPQVVTEREGEDGVLTRSVDFDALRQTLSDSLVEGSDERYRLDWPGKRASLLKANTPIAKTLRPDRASSVDFDTTQNVFIEGDNFEALKILQESYLGKVKMIYIDPPYNTGNDFVYSDNFTQDKAEYDEEIEAVDEEGNKMFRENTRTNPRFHSDWLSMMYERLTIARDLLQDNGVIFISIDDNEVHNLRKVCDEIFGENNFLASFIWESKLTGGHDATHINDVHEYIVSYAKNKFFGDVVNKRLSSTEYPEFDEETNRNFKWDSLWTVSHGYTKNCDYPIVAPDGTEVYPWMCHKDGELVKGIARWFWSKETFLKQNDQLLIKQNKGGNWKVYKRIYGGSEIPYKSVLVKDEVGGTSHGKEEVESLFKHVGHFDNPKSTLLLKNILAIGIDKESIIIDFFSGSATTAHAVMAQNAEDGGNRKFIMVQLAEETPEGSEASKAEYKTIAEIGRERIRRAAAKIKVDYAEELAKRATPLDIGFRAYTVADTAFLDVERHPAELEQGQLLELANNIKSDRTPEDLLTQVMLELGLTLDLPIETKKVVGNEVFFVGVNALVACFDSTLHDGMLDEIVKIAPLKLVLRDTTFGIGDDRDQARSNVETKMKRLSPETTISIL